MLQMKRLLAVNAGFQLGGSYEYLLGVIDKFNSVSNQNATCSI